jgi:integrase
MTGHGAKYARKQEEAIAALLTQRNIDEAAKAIGVSPNTLLKWMKQPDFDAAYQTARLAEEAGPKTINDEVLLLLRLCGDQGDLIRAKLRREKALKLTLPPSPGRAYTADEKARMLPEAQKLRSKNMYPALVVDLNCGLRDKELRELRWRQIDLVDKKQLTVGKSKTDAGTGRVIPLNDTVMIALEAHAAWYVRRFGECKPNWYVFPAGKGQPNDPTRPVTTLRTAWTKVRDKAKVVGRWHDNRHTLVTELAESGAGDEVIMSIAGHVSRAMLSRYSHVRMEAKRRALDEIAARQRAADQNRIEATQKLVTETQLPPGTPRVQ